MDDGTGLNGDEQELAGGPPPEDMADGELLRMNIFQGDLLELPRPDEGVPGFLPDWYEGNLPALVFPPLSERGIELGGKVDLQITPFHLYYGALRELAESANPERAATLKKLIAQWNENAALELCELGRFFVENDLETALLHYELALEIDDELYEALQNCGMCEYALASVPGEDREERLTSAEDLFRRATWKEPNHGFSWWSWARALHDLGREDESRALLWQFAQEYPDAEDRELVEAALARGFEASDTEGAGNEVQRTFVEAQQKTFGDNPAGAVDLLLPLAEAYPDSGEIWFVLGAAQRRAGNFEEAERCLRRAARLTPNEPFVWWELARAYLDDGQLRDADDAIGKALGLEPDNALYLADQGRIRLALGDPDGAAEAIDRAVNLAPEDPEVQAAASLLDAADQS